MRKFSLALSILVCSFVIAPASVVAKDAFDLSATSAEEFRKQADALRAEMNAQGKHASLSSADKSRIGKQLDNLQKLYDNRAAGKEFKRSDEAKLVNASEEINGILSGNEDDRLVCEQVRKLGTNRTERVCMTVAERNERREEAARDLRNQGSSPYRSGGG